MDRLEKVNTSVEKLYLANNSEADPWTHWGYKNHVLVVAKNAERSWI